MSPFPDGYVRPCALEAAEYVSLCAHFYPLTLAGLPGERPVCAMKASSHLLLEEMGSFVFSSALGVVDRQGTFCFIDGVSLTSITFGVDRDLGEGSLMMFGWQRL